MLMNTFEQCSCFPFIRLSFTDLPSALSLWIHKVHDVFGPFQITEADVWRMFWVLHVLKISIFVLRSGRTWIFSGSCSCYRMDLWLDSDCTMLQCCIHVCAGRLYRIWRNSPIPSHFLFCVWHFWRCTDCIMQWLTLRNLCSGSGGTLGLTGPFLRNLMLKETDLFLTFSLWDSPALFSVVMVRRGCPFQHVFQLKRWRPWTSAGLGPTVSSSSALMQTEELWSPPEKVKTPTGGTLKQDPIPTPLY